MAGSCWIERGPSRFEELVMAPKQLTPSDEGSVIRRPSFLPSGRFVKSVVESRESLANRVKCPVVFGVSSAWA